MAPRSILAALAVLAGVVVWFLPAPAESPAIWRTAGVLTVALGLWATQVLPEYFAAVIFFLLAVTFGGSPAEVVFSGFHSTGAWMIFGGLIIGYGVQSTGLGERIAARLMRRLARCYLGILATAVAIAALIGFLVPSNTGRIVVLVPIFMALADRFGFAPGSNGRAGLVLAVGAGAIYPSFAVLPAAVPNLVMAGAAESIHGITFTWADYFITLYPVVGVVPVIALPLVLYRILPDRPGARPDAQTTSPPGPGEMKVALVLALALVLWITDFAHGIKPAWVAVGAAVLLLMPRIGIAGPETMVTRINFAPWIFIAGVIGAGAVLAHSGLGTRLAVVLFDAVAPRPGQDALNLVIVCAIGTVMALVATIPGQPAIMTSLAPEIAQAAGWPLATAIQAQVVTWAMTVFPYQLPPMILAIQVAGVRAGHLIRLQVAMLAVAWLVMLPLLYLWWTAIGKFG